MLAKHKVKPGFDKTSFLEQCKEQWKNLSDKKKVFWIDWALDREAKYQVRNFIYIFTPSNINCN